MRFLTFSLFFICGCVSEVENQTIFPLFGNLDPGAFEVGTKQLNFSNQKDSTEREIRIQLWYPAKNTSAEKLKFADYLNYKNEFSGSELYETLATSIAGDPQALSMDTLDVLLTASMMASKNAEEYNSQFPLLIWSSRYGTVAYQSVLCEYLASHGYVVAFAEDIPNSSYPWQIANADEKQAILFQHVDDINASINFLKSQKNIDGNKIGLLSWSYAGESAILSQMNNPDIKLVIGLSSIAFYSGLYLGAALNQQVVPEKLNVPYLILSEKIGTRGNELTRPEILDDMHSMSKYVSFTTLAHGNFNAIEGMIPGMLRTPKVQSWSKGGELAQVGYETICKVSLSFLNAVFKDTSSDSFDEKMTQLQSELSLDFINIQ